MTAMATPELKGKDVVVYGLGKSGLAAVKLLLREGASATVVDSRPAPEVRKALADAKLTANVGEPTAERLRRAELVVVSPGVPLAKPELVETRKAGVTLWGEVELAFRFLEDSAGFWIGITGTNGKSTTTRLIAHIASRAGRTVGMTNSDGIFVRGECVEAGDWTGFGGAARVLAEPGVDLAVLETARGGILLRGIGYAANDVSVVTNVSADHLGLQGIDTVDELADVKAAIVRITKREGWAVLNADDPRVWAMRRETRAGIYAFSLDGRTAAVEEALDGGGRVAVLEKDWLVLRAPGRRPRRLAEAAALPVTFAGLSRYNVANALAAAAACDALGLTTRQIAGGLRTFGLDVATNPGRLNLYERDGTFALVDFAHNEAGLTGLMDVARAVAGRRGSVRLAFGTAGDRTDEILHRLGVVAGGADDLIIAEKEHYLRGRDLGEMNELLRAGARAGGFRGRIPSAPSELAALQHVLRRAKRGDVCVVMAHVERAELFAWLEANGFEPVAIERLRRHLGR